MYRCSNKLSRFTIICFLIVFSCQKDGNNNSVDPPKEEFFIENLGVNFGTWNNNTNHAGDFYFTPELNKVFYEFGAQVTAWDGSIKELPTFEYILKKDAILFAIADGEVVRMEYQGDTQDYEFSIRSLSDPDYDIVYDHVINVAINLGDNIQAGDTLGNPGTFSATHGRFEIMINNLQTGLSYCPLCYISESKSEEYREKVLQLIRDWETFKGDTTIYDEENHFIPGCRYEAMINN